MCRNLFIKRLATAITICLILYGCDNNAGKHDIDPAAESPPKTATNEILEVSISRAANALWTLQAEDGGWHSSVYGHFKPGAAESALVLSVLSRLPARELAKHKGAVKNAIKFLANSQGNDGGLGTKDEWLEVPTYTTSLGILGFSRLKADGWQKTIEPWVKYLKSAQNSDENGCKSSEPPYGGWGPEGHPHSGIPRRSDISSTRFALQALVAAGVPSDDKLWVKAEEFVKRTQGLSSDGGFTFSPTNPELNKAGRESKDSLSFRSYGSSSADGGLCWNSLRKQKSPDLPRGTAELWVDRWLFAHSDAEHCQGFQGTEMERVGWKDGLTFYYRAALAEVSSLLDRNSSPKFPWEKLAQATMKTQLNDGTWINEVTIMKEDDPLVATSFALETLFLCREALSTK